MEEAAEGLLANGPQQAGDDGDSAAGARGSNAGSRTEAETEACLGDIEGHSQRAILTELSAAFPVYLTIHRIRRLATAAINDATSSEQLKDPRMSGLVVHPLVDRLYDPEDISVVYCLLANRVQFLRQQSSTVHQSVTLARAALCEMVATQILSRFHEENPGSDGILLLSRMLVQGFDPFQGAPDSVQLDGRRRQSQWLVQERDGHEKRKLTALELAIISESKSFVASSACQRVVTAVYEGRVVYTPLSLMDILPDHYKHHPITLYDPSEAPILNHYRLIVPRSRNVIEFVQFLVLLVLYILTMVYRNKSGTGINTGTGTGTGTGVFEFLFCIYTAGWVLSELAAVFEHGWEVHSQNLWSFLDLTFTAIYSAYLAARLYDLATGLFPLGHGPHVLCIAAPVLLTRVAFNLLPDSIVFISVHAVMKDFMLLTFLAAWCFMGFLLALQWLIDSDDGNGNGNAGSVSTPSWATIVKWMLWIWFGLDGTGMEESVQFHIVFGPALMVGFAFLGNTLFLTILVAMLTNTFSRIIADALAEVQFRRTVLTFEGVKSDAIFSYPPPFNIVALAVLLPLKFAVSPRVFHSVNVALIRALNLPTLLLISLYERRRFSPKVAARRGAGGNSSFLNWSVTGFSPYGDVQAVFKTPLPPEVEDEIERLDPTAEEKGAAAEWASPVMSVPGFLAGDAGLSVPQRRVRVRLNED